LKLLHVSDWHLGCVTRNVSRQPDHETVIRELLAIARQEHPDLILHTGDLFDQARPAYEILQLGIESLQELAALSPTVVLAGNHDSPALFRLFQRLAGPESRLRFLDRARPPDAGGILELPGPRGETIRLAPLPFVHQNRMIEAFDDPATWMASYSDRIQRIETALGRGLQERYDPARDVLLFAAHLHVGGAVFSNSERSIHITDSYSTRVEHLPPVSYAAFGHIHRPQALPGSLVPGRYAGSPIQMDFGELGEQKSVVVVEAEPGRPAVVRTLPLSGGRPLRRFAGTLEELAREAAQFRGQLCALAIHTPAHLPDLSDRVRDLLPGAVLLEVIEVPADREVTALTAADFDQSDDAGLEALFREYLGEQGTQKGSADTVLALFSELLRDLSHDEPVVLRELDTLARVASESERGRGETPTPQEVPAPVDSGGVAS
jgi:exonuclease SbcD